ncbi:hypothetical protein CTAYLR_008326 [Chrysophaeum taylorii]|uniref:Right handed beta helix domain-containing protein n=1 Tax=Chrysophaeum taylorii TaxID=2483200 RepID=A0AAD7XGM6_9STRA|nr:hypothetical protein CTAYLR_008326 [Chrysophaeum taylorii]
MRWRFLMGVAAATKETCLPLILRSGTGFAWHGFEYVVSDETGKAIAIGTFETRYPLVTSQETQVCSVVVGSCYSFEVRQTEEFAASSSDGRSWDLAGIAGDTLPYGPAIFFVANETSARIDDGRCGGPTFAPSNIQTQEIEDDENGKPPTSAPSLGGPSGTAAPAYSDTSACEDGNNFAFLYGGGGVVLASTTIQVVEGCVATLGRGTFDGGGDGTARGGGVRVFWVRRGGSLYASRGTVRGGFDSVRGGGILVEGIVEAEDMVIEGCYAPYGAGIFVSRNAELVATGVLFRRNFGDAGAATYAVDGRVDLKDVVAVENVGDFRLGSPSSSSSSPKNNSAQCGAAVGVEGGEAELIVRDSLFEENFLVTYTLFSWNHDLDATADPAEIREATRQDRWGGGVVCATDRAAATISGSRFERNWVRWVVTAVDDLMVVESGGDVSANFEATVVVEDCTISGSFGGGGTSSYLGFLGLYRTLITNVTSSVSGGALAALRYSFAYVEDSLIFGNSALAGGGAASFVSTLSMRNTTIRNNTAKLRDGGCRIDLGSLASFEDCVVADNVADGRNGGIGVEGSSSLELRRVGIFGNRAKDGGGGGLAVRAASAATVLDSEFEANRADYGAGVVVSDESSATFEGARISANRAAATASAVLVERNSKITFDSVSTTDNNNNNNAFLDDDDGGVVLAAEICGARTLSSEGRPAGMLVCDNGRADILRSSISDNVALDHRAIVQIADTFLDGNVVDCGATSTIYGARLEVERQRIRASSSCTALLFQINGIGSRGDVARNITRGSIGAVSSTWWTWPCEPGSTSSDGLEHGTNVLDKEGNSIDDNDPFCDPEVFADCPEPCAPCPGGRYVDFTLDRYRLIGVDACFECPIGRAAPDDQDPSSHDSVDDCEFCPPGTASAAAGSSSCVPCEPGTFASYSGSASCRLAMPGRFASDGIHEIECPPGRYSVGASSECTNCSAGSYQPAYGRTACLLASPGNHVPDSGAIAEIPCRPGSYSSTSAARSCATCEKGEFAADHASRQCSPAEAGYFVPAANASAQLPSPPGTFASTAGTSAPLPCPPSTFTNNSASTSCTPCVAGYYWDSYRWTETGRADFIASGSQCTTCCRRCGPGLSCDREGTRLERLPVKRGFWRPDRAASQVYECDYEDACAGGDQVDSQCRKGHKKGSVLCEVCENSFRYDVARRRCVDCRAGGGATLAIVFFLACVLAVGFILKLLGIRPSTLCDASVITQTLHKPTVARVCEIGQRSTTEGGGGDSSPSASWRQSLFTKLKILVATSPFADVVALTNVLFHIDVMRLFDTECWYKASYFQRHAVVTLFPVVLALVLLLPESWLAGEYYCLPRPFVVVALQAVAIFCSVARQCRRERSTIWGKFVFALLVLSYIAYPSCSSITFSYFDCSTFDRGEGYDGRGSRAKSVMDADRNTNCDSSIYKARVPAAYAVMLWRNRAKINPSISIADVDFDQYAPAFPADVRRFKAARVQDKKLCVRKGQDDLDALKLLFAEFKFYAPYVDDEDDLLADLANFQLVLHFIAAILVYMSNEVGKEESTFQSLAFGTILVFVLCLTFFAATWTILISAFGANDVKSRAASIKRFLSSVTSEWSSSRHFSS